MVNIRSLKSTFVPARFDNLAVKLPYHFIVNAILYCIAKETFTCLRYNLGGHLPSKTTKQPLLENV